MEFEPKGVCFVRRDRGEHSDARIRNRHATAATQTDPGSSVRVQLPASEPGVFT